jgi:hypothetical protein
MVYCRLRPKEVHYYNKSKRADADTSIRERCSTAYLGNNLSRRSSETIFGSILQTLRSRPGKKRKAISDCMEKVPVLLHILRIVCTISFVKHINRLRHYVDKVSKWLNLRLDYAAGIVKVMAHSADRPSSIDRKSIEKCWRCHKKQLGSDNTVGKGSGS